MGGLGTTYNVHLRLIGKLAVDFLLVFIELFSLGVTAEALRANIVTKKANNKPEIKYIYRIFPVITMVMTSTSAAVEENLATFIVFQRTPSSLLWPIQNYI